MPFPGVMWQGQEGRRAVTRTEARQSRAEQGCGRDRYRPHSNRQGDISEAVGQSGAQHQRLGRDMLTASRKRHESLEHLARGRKRPRPG